VDVELTLPTAPVTLAPGVPTRVPAQVRNPYAQPLRLRAYLARGRASGWATVDPPVLELGPGETAEIGVVLQTPPTQPPSASLVPFTLHVEEAETGDPAGFATALLTIAMPVPVAGELVTRTDRRFTYDLRLANKTRAAVPLRISAALEPAGGRTTVRPEAVLLEPGAWVTVAVRAKPKPPLSGRPRRFDLVVKVQDAYDAERVPYLTEVATGTRRPRVSTRMAAVTAVLLVLGGTAAIAYTRDKLPFVGGPDPKSSTAAAPAAATVRKPYALLEVFPHRGADGGKADAEAAQARFAAAGMPVRLVDSLSSDVLADEGAGFWVLLQDGFSSTADAQAYCNQWRPLAPKCAVTP
jgi:hypothetical protein